MATTTNGPNLDPTAWAGLPPTSLADRTQVVDYFQALDNFCRVFAIKPGDRVLLLTDPLLDPRVVEAISGLAKARGATASVFMAASTTLPSVPEEIRPLIRSASFVVSTWFCSIEDPFNIAMRKAGQRWVKITYFRDLDLLKTPQARFPLDLIGEIIRATERRFPKGRAFDLRFEDARGSDLRIGYTAEMRDKMFSGNRWRGIMAAEEPGCYVHYIPTHGPNFWDSTAMADRREPATIDGILYPQGAIGFDHPFDESIAVVFEKNRVIEVRGHSDDAQLLRDMLIQGRLIEGGGCGFNPKAPRGTVYPAGSNSPGALHFGIELARPSDYLRRVLPNWEEPPVHQDLITFDSTATAGGQSIIERGFLTALRDPVVVERASLYGDPVDLLENFPD
jgi:hypothetical protein